VEQNNTNERPIPRNVNKIVNDKPQTTAMKTKLIINGIEINAIIDSGAGPNVITNKLRQRLGRPIMTKSSERFILADGSGKASLGKTEILIEIDEELEIPIQVEVIDSNTEELIIGNDALVELKANIDYESESMTIEYNDEIIEMTIGYNYGEMDEVSEDEWNENDEYDYENGDIRNLYSVIRKDDDDPKAQVLA
jgi:gag-polyprotein putative aspartyl protease